MSHILNTLNTFKKKLFCLSSYEEMKGCWGMCSLVSADTSSALLGGLSHSLSDLDLCRGSHLEGGFGAPKSIHKTSTLLPSSWIRDQHPLSCSSPYGLGLLCMSESPHKDAWVTRPRCASGVTPSRSTSGKQSLSWEGDRKAFLQVARVQVCYQDGGFGYQQAGSWLPSLGSSPSPCCLLLYDAPKKPSRMQPSCVLSKFQPLES